MFSILQSFFNHHTCTVLASVRVKLNGNTIFSLKKNIFVNDFSSFSVQFKSISLAWNFKFLKQRNQHTYSVDNMDLT